MQVQQKSLTKLCPGRDKTSTSICSTKNLVICENNGSCKVELKFNSKSNIINEKFTEITNKKMNTSTEAD